MIELMVAAAITALIAGALVTVASNAALVWKRGTGSLSIDNRANFVLNQIEKDLGSIIWYPGNVNRGFIAEVRDTTPSWWNVTSTHRTRPNSESLEVSGNTDVAQRRFGEGGTLLAFLARTQDGNTPEGMGMFSYSPKNLPTIVSYQMVREEEEWELDGGGSVENVRYRLYRSVVRPGITNAGAGVLDNFYNVGTNLQDTIYHPAGPADMDPTDPFDPGTVSIPHPLMVIADGVVDFGIAAYDSTTGEEIEFNTSGGLLPLGNSQQIGMVTVFVRLLTEEGILLLSQHEVPPAGNDEWWRDVVLPNSKVFTRRIPIRVGMF